MHMYLYMYIGLGSTCRFIQKVLLEGSVVSSKVYIDSFVIYTTIYMYIDICICVYKHICIYIQMYVYIYMYIGLGSTCRLIQLILLAGSVVSGIVYIDNYVIYTTIYIYIQICICVYIYTSLYIYKYIYIYMYICLGSTCRFIQ